MPDQDDDIEQWVDLLRGKKISGVSDTEVAFTRQIRMAIIRHELRSIDRAGSEDQTTEPIPEGASGGAGGASPVEISEDLYGTLSKLAAARLRNLTVPGLPDIDALVRESYSRLLDSDALEVGDPAAFLALASRIMRAIIIDVVRQRQSRGHSVGSEGSLDTILALFDTAHSYVSDALNSLVQVDPLMAEAVEMRFGGHSESEIAAALGVTDREVRRLLERARLLIKAT
jgi:DNA-directed RNA polymerase specialized sigma24 family protein